MHNQIHRVGDLELSQDLQLQEQVWRYQRFGWVIFGILVLLMGLGLFGEGPISNTQVSRSDGLLVVEYERFGRLMAQNLLRVHVVPKAMESGTVRVWINRDFIETIQIQQITPQPDQVEAIEDRIFYSFRIGEAYRPQLISFYFSPQEVGLHSVAVGLEGDREVNFDEFIFP